MPQMQSYNTRAAGEALKAIGGDLLVNVFEQLYETLDRAERAGHEDGYYLGRQQADTECHNEGYDSGYADGSSEVVDEAVEEGIKEFNTEDTNDLVRPNAQPEGFTFPVDNELKIAAAALDASGV